MKLFTFIILFLCGFINPTFAQKEDTNGIFVLTDGTKGNGRIEYRLADFYSRAKLVVKNDQGTTKYPIHTIQSFVINNHHYVRVDNIPRRNKAIYGSGSHNDPIFLELVESGEIEVYRYGHLYQSGNTTSCINTPVFAKRNTNTYLVFIPKKPIGFYDRKARNTEAISNLFSNAPEIQSLILADKIDQEQLLNRIHQFNITGK